MLIVAHKIGFARKISDTLVFMKNGIVENFGNPDYIFNSTKNENTKNFLNAVL